MVPHTYYPSYLGCRRSLDQKSKTSKGNLVRLDIKIFKKKLSSVAENTQHPGFNHQYPNKKKFVSWDIINALVVFSFYFLLLIYPLKESSINI